MPPAELPDSSDLSYKIRLNLDQLDEIWAQVGR